MRIFKSKKGVVILEGLEEDGSRRLHTLLLKKSGKTKLLGTLTTEETIYSMLSSLVWIDGAGGPGGSPAAKGHYLLFFGGDTGDEWLSVVYVAKLNAVGKIIQQPEKIFEVKFPHKNGEIGLYGLGATRGSASVAVAATMSVYNSDTSMCYLKGRFFETDFDGNLVGGVRDIPFDEKVKQWGGNMRPAWSGKKWLSPIWAESDAPDSCRCYVAAAGSVVGAAPAGVPEIRLSLVFKGGAKESVVGDSCFLPDSLGQQSSGGIAASAKGPNLLLNISKEHESYLDSLSEPVYRAFVQPFKSQGGKEKQTTPVPFEAWDTIFQAEQNWKFSFYHEYLSDFLVSDSGDYIVARADSIRKYASGPPLFAADKYLGRFGLLSVDGDFKKVTPILWQELLNNEYIDASPLLRRFGDVCWIVARTRRGNEYKEYFFLVIYSLSSMSGK